MKFIITATDFEALGEELKKLYTKQADGSYKLSVDGLPEPEDTTALKNAKEHEKKARQEAEKKVRDLEAQLGKKAKEDGDIDALEKSWQDKLTKREQELTLVIEGHKSQLQKILVDNVAQEIASRISTAPRLILPHIKDRLRVEEKDGELITRVIDGAGKPSALSLKDLESEFVASTDFASIIIGSKGSGSGAQGNHKGGSAKPFNELTEAERTDLYRRDPDAYERARQV